MNKNQFWVPWSCGVGDSVLLICLAKIYIFAPPGSRSIFLGFGGAGRYFSVEDYKMLTGEQ